MFRISLILITLMSSPSIFAQESEPFTKSRPSFGFNLGLNYSNLYNRNDNSQFEIQNAPGFRLGLISDFPFADRWSIAPKAELSFNYGSILENNVNYRVDPFNMDFMAHVKYKLNQFDNNLGAYCYLGPNMRLPFSGDSNINSYDTRAAFGFDFGFGVDMHLQHFTISPEIRFTGGLTDIRTNPSGNMLRGSNAAFVLNFSGK